MTVDEAIICLSDMKIKVAIPKAAVQARLNNDALNMAIEALNCSEIPNNSDTISRQVALETIRSMQTYKLFAGDDMILVDKAQVQTELMMLPPAQPEPEAISEWKKEFREYVGSLDIARDDWKGIIEYIGELPSAQSDVIRCKDCVNYIDHRCVVADHHVAPFSCCQSVFGAKKKGEKE